MASLSKVKSQRGPTQKSVGTTKETLDPLDPSIQALEDKFKGLLEASPDAMLIVDEGGRIVLVNSQTEKLFGFMRSEIIGQGVESLIPQRFHNKHPGHRDG